MMNQTLQEAADAKRGSGTSLPPSISIVKILNHYTGDLAQISSLLGRIQSQISNQVR